MKKVIPLILAIIFGFSLCGCAQITGVSGIEMDLTYLNIEVGEKRMITASVLPTTADNKNIEWTSSDDEIATVKNGYVRAKKKGECKITATTKDGSYSKSLRLIVRERGLYVDKSYKKGDEGYGIWQFDTINGALAAAEHDDVIYLNKGVYNEVANITKNVQIYGDNATIVGNLTLGHPTLKDYATDVRIANITFINDGYYPSISIGNECENVRIDNCKFFGVDGDLPAIKTYESGEAGAIKKIGIYDCEFSDYDRALAFYQYVVKGEIEHNRFRNCAFAAYLEGSQMTKICANTLKNSGFIEFDGARVLTSGVVLEENIIENMLEDSPFIIARYGDLEKGQKLDLSKNTINGVKVENMTESELEKLKSLIEVKNEITGEGDHEFIIFNKNKKR